ncbi:amiloride-sensitive sodium channel subunit alpha-like [Saccostrea cucullata]|uniref:amiloride-sensitive sodium channel subunit alpha-like n=1 Tax=Saccostrea cuccullata TaxID=36930 RepID=UPI002ED32B83
MERLRKHIQKIVDKRKAKKEKYDSVKDVFHSLGVQTSLHGIPRILSSKHWYQRGLWTCLVLVTFGFLVHQIYQLVDEYTNYPIKTKVSMKRDTLRFPAVSLCNMNPVKYSSLSLINGSELKNIIDPVPEERKVSNLNNIANEEVTSASPFRTTSLTSSSPLWTTSSHDNGSTNHSDYSYYDDDWYYWWWWDYWFNDYYLDLNSDQDDSYRQSASDFGDYLENQRAWENDEWSEKIEYFKYLFQNQSKDTRKELGHLIKDMLISCSFNGKKCSAE